MIPRWGQTRKQYIDVLASYAHDAGYNEVTRGNLHHYDGWLKDWLIPDCRTSSSQPYNVANTKLWRAVFATDFSSVEILDSSNEVVVPRFALTA